MSSYVCDEKTITAVINAYRNVEHESLLPMSVVTLSALGNRLHMLNVRATACRYRSEPVQEFDYAYRVVGFGNHNNRGLLHLYQAIGEYLYQCSEGDFPNDPLFKEVEGVKAKLADNIIRRMIERNAEDDRITAKEAARLAVKDDQGVKFGWYDVERSGVVVKIRYRHHHATGNVIVENTKPDANLGWMFPAFYESEGFGCAIFRPGECYHAAALARCPRAKPLLPARNDTRTSLF